MGVTFALCIYVPHAGSDSRSQRRVSYGLELKLQMVRATVWVLVIEPAYSGQAAAAL